MALTSGLKTPRDMLAKLHREHDRLKDAVTGGDLMNFAITAYHLIDWIKKDPSFPPAAQSDLDALYRNTLIAACRDIANGSKHFELRKGYEGRVADKTSAVSGYGAGGFGKGPFGIGEESITIVLLDGQRFDALSFSQGVLEVWEEFFRKHG